MQKTCRVRGYQIDAASLPTGHDFLLSLIQTFRHTDAKTTVQNPNYLACNRHAMNYHLFLFLDDSFDLNFPSNFQDIVSLS